MLFVHVYHSVHKSSDFTYVGMSQEKNGSIFLLILILDFAFCISLAICKEIK